MFEEFWICHCGYAALPASAIYGDAGHRERVYIPMLLGVAQHATRGPVLIDVPFGHDGVNNVGSALGMVLRATAMEFDRDWSVIPRLEQLGIRPGEVNDVLITHMHFDHTGGMKELSHAHFHVNPREWNFAHALSRFGTIRYGYVPSDWRALGSRALLMDLPPELADDETDGADLIGHDLFGDGSVLAIGLEGHSPGHTGYLITMAHGPKIFVVGDAAYGLQSVHTARDPGWFFKRSAYNLPRATQTLHALRRWYRANPDTILVSTHDPDLGKRVRSEPLRLDVSEASQGARQAG